MRKYKIDLLSKEGIKLDKDEVVNENKLIDQIKHRLGICVPGEKIVIEQVK